ncbi:hypothetical protein SLEP1_g56246 [Rubroshorea leprosula]|uniref:Uncharacterized protein n=1 Tax=Rubroshorea leprosula TaxID=152421 RepID=A0AAV5MHY8_9ROSI|nr:hypothetical protein SLEP1_g56246 [Rubroshorea leprosula]
MSFSPKIYSLLFVFSPKIPSPCSSLLQFLQFFTQKSNHCCHPPLQSSPSPSSPLLQLSHAADPTLPLQFIISAKQLLDFLCINLGKCYF